jgi:hypothetical protein
VSAFINNAFPFAASAGAEGKWKAMEGNTMALEHDGEYFTKLTHVENGNAIVRRIHRIEVQAADGRLHVIKGRYLPDFIQTNTGRGFKGVHLAQILLSPRSVKPDYVPPTCRPWPIGRDVLHIVIGILVAIAFRFFLSVIANCL